MASRIVQRRRPDHPDESRCLRRRSLVQVLVEDIARRLRHPGDRRAVVRAHRYVVDVTLEDLIFAQPYLDHQRHGQLAPLARKRALVAIDKGPRELLGQRARALAQVMRSQIRNRRFDHPHWVESRMIVEVTVLGREQAAHKVGRKIV